MQQFHQNINKEYNKIQVKYLVIILILDFSEKPNIFNQSRFDMFIIHKLAEYIELLFQKLVGEINLQN